MAFEAQKAAARAGGWQWDAQDPNNWKAIAGQQQAQQNGWTWNPTDPSNWTHIAAQQAQGGTPAAATPQAEPGVAAPTATPGADTSGAQARAVFDTMSAYLTEAGLGDLFTVTNGVPSGWLWEQIVGGVDSTAALQAALEQTTSFKSRYGVIGEMRQRAAAGEPVHVPTVSEVRAYESTVSSMLRQAGAPPWFYDTYSDMQTLMSQGLSAAEVEQRLGDGWDRVANSSPAVRQAYHDMYGVAEGDAALFATFLDPTKTLSSLERSSRAAYAKGMGRDQGLNIDTMLAERIAGLPKSDASVLSDLQQVSKLKGLTTEGIGEANDLTLEREGIDATVFGDQAASSALERRLLTRQAVGKSSQGGAALTNRGVSGLG